MLVKFGKRTPLLPQCIDHDVVNEILDRAEEWNGYSAFLNVILKSRILLYCYFQITLVGLKRCVLL